MRSATVTPRKPVFSMHTTTPNNVSQGVQFTSFQSFKNFSRQHWNYEWHDDLDKKRTAGLIWVDDSIYHTSHFVFLLR